MCDAPGAACWRLPDSCFELFVGFLFQECCCDLSCVAVEAFFVNGRQSLHDLLNPVHVPSEEHARDLKSIRNVDVGCHFNESRHDHQSVAQVIKWQ